MVSDRAFLLHMGIPCGETFSLLLRKGHPARSWENNQGYL